MMRVLQEMLLLRVPDLLSTTEIVETVSAGGVSVMVVVNVDTVHVVVVVIVAVCVCISVSVRVGPWVPVLYVN
jgi:hypothetical protein